MFMMPIVPNDIIILEKVKGFRDDSARYFFAKATVIMGDVVCFV